MTPEELADIILTGLREKLPAEKRDLLSCGWSNPPYLRFYVPGHECHEIGLGDLADPNSLHRAEEWLASIDWGTVCGLFTRGPCPRGRGRCSTDDCLEQVYGGYDWIPNCWWDRDQDWRVFDPSEETD